jgi:hypothetical protein
LNVNTIEIEDNGFIKKLLLLVFVKTEIKPTHFIKSDWKKMFNNYEMKKLYFELFTSFVLMFSLMASSLVNRGLNKSFSIIEKLKNIFRQLFQFTFRLVSVEDNNTSNTTIFYNNYNNTKTIFFEIFKSRKESLLNTLIINY